ncbi:hypothetical protein [Herbiconiux solani]|uniref:hypothetical protein n=1 Tax=Herbiconiux solani TaxID=661329 RepID=UPI0012EE2D3A|nr:hypothetical protein [Herbiconiux solani]
MDLIGYVASAAVTAAAAGLVILAGKMTDKITDGVAKRIDDHFSKTRREGLTAEFDMK